MIDKFDYRESVQEDIRDYLNKCNYGYIDDDLAAAIYADILDNTDIVAASARAFNIEGNSYKLEYEILEEHLCHNMDLLQRAIDVMQPDRPRYDDAMHMDRIIRNYLLEDCLHWVIDTEHNPKYLKKEINND